MTWILSNILKDHFCLIEGAALDWKSELWTETHCFYLNACQVPITWKKWNPSLPFHGGPLCLLLIHWTEHSTHVRISVVLIPRGTSAVIWPKFRRPNYDLKEEKGHILAVRMVEKPNLRYFLQYQPFFSSGKWPNNKRHYQFGVHVIKNDNPEIASTL